MRVGLYGGSFNPIHFGHLRAAEEDREVLGLDLLYFIPAASPPHKQDGHLAAADQRLNMVRLATKGNRHFMVSDAEIRRSGRSYTIDTVRHFKETMRAQAELHLIMGADQFNELETWKSSDELVKLCHLVVHTRPLVEGSQASHASLATVKHFGYVREDDHYVHPGGYTLAFITTTFLPISATLIRHKIAAQESVRYLLPDDVTDYIRRHKVYL
ncbi:MAG TPA: nicotinate-nucleotide adenylyltransferase [Candidatus Binataceae bacterium]|nr:nicotinate-nucleotide adenylyltransferase [Candidatus Binataceae bacterium]